MAWKPKFAFLLVLSFAGCVGPAAPDMQPASACAIPSEPLNMTMEASDLPIGSCRSLSFSELRWSSRLKGDVAVEFQFDFGPKNVCEADQRFAGITGHRANRVLLFLDYGDRVAMGGGGPADLVKARAANVDTSEVPIVTGAWANGFGSKGWEVSGRVNVTIAALDLDPTTPFMQDASMKILWRCEHPFELLHLRGSREVHLFGPGDFDGGASAYVHYPVPFSYLETSVEYEGVLSATFASQAVVLRGATVQSAAKATGTLHLFHPTGQETWNLDTASAYVHEGTAGDYRLTITRAGGGDLDYFGGLLAGLDSIHRLRNAETL